MYICSNPLSVVGLILDKDLLIRVTAKVTAKHLQTPSNDFDNQVHRCSHPNHNPVEKVNVSLS